MTCGDSLSISSMVAPGRLSRWPVIWLWAPALWVTGCVGGGGGTCAPGTTRACFCEDGAQGEQLCDSNGGVSACACGDQTDAGDGNGRGFPSFQTDGGSGGGPADGSGVDGGGAGSGGTGGQQGPSGGAGGEGGSSVGGQGGGSSGGSSGGSVGGQGGGSSGGSSGGNSGGSSGGSSGGGGGGGSSGGGGGDGDPDAGLGGRIDAGASGGQSGGSGGAGGSSHVDPTCESACDWYAGCTTSDDPDLCRGLEAYHYPLLYDDCASACEQQPELANALADVGTCEEVVALFVNADYCSGALRDPPPQTEVCRRFAFAVLECMVLSCEPVTWHGPEAFARLFQLNCDLAIEQGNWNEREITSVVELGDDRCDHAYIDGNVQMATDPQGDLHDFCADGEPLHRAPGCQEICGLMPECLPSFSLYADPDSCLALCWAFTSAADLFSCMIPAQDCEDALSCIGGPP